MAETLKYSFLALALILCSCKTRVSDECQEYFQTLQKEFTFNESTGLYQIRPVGRSEAAFVLDLQHRRKNCFMSLGKKEVLELFGVPSRKYISPISERYYYYMTSSCESDFDRNCESLEVQFGADGQFRSADIVVVTTYN